MITFFIVGSIVGAVLSSVFVSLKLLIYKEEVDLLKKTIERLETLNSNLLYNSLSQTMEKS